MSVKGEKFNLQYIAGDGSEFGIPMPHVIWNLPLSQLEAQPDAQDRTTKANALPLK